MIRKFFPSDKNYILEQAQLSLKDSLLGYLVDFVKVEYLLRHNPLGLVDQTVQRINDHTDSSTERLSSFYLTLMGIFRFRYYFDNQLEFPFDGRDPLARYQEEWSDAFRGWAREFCHHPRFLWGVLELTVFQPREEEARFIGNRLQAFLTDHFEVRLHEKKGLLSKIA